MEYEAMKVHLYDMNEDEVFYKTYYYARQQEYSLQKFLANLDMKDVLARKLVIMEKKETLPPVFEDSFFFDLTDNNSIVVQRHNRYAPAFVHHHTFFELVYVYDGRCSQTISGQEVSMHTGDVCIIPPEIEHSLSVFDESIVINIMIRKDTLNTIFYNFLNTKNILSSFFINNIYAKHANDYIIFHTGSDIVLKEAFLRMLWENINMEKYYYQCISSCLTLCFHLLVRSYEDSVQMPTFASKLDVQRYALIRYIQENYRDVNLCAIGERFHYTPEYASRIIKETTGMTFTEIVLRIRMEKAKEMLLNTSLTIASIAEEIGYDSQEHFIRVFKKNNHTTPTTFRKNGY